MKPEAERFLRSVVDLAEVARVPELYALAGVAVRALELEGLEVERPRQPLPPHSATLLPMSSTERSRKHRELQRNATKCNDATLQNVAVAPSLYDLSTEKDTEETQRESALQRNGNVASVARVASQRGGRAPASDASSEELAGFTSRWAIDSKHPEYPKFLDHWRAQPGQRGVKLDWGATWRNWVRRSGEFAPRSPSGQRLLPEAPPPRSGKTLQERERWEREAREAGPVNVAELVAKAQSAMTGVGKR